LVKLKAVIDMSMYAMQQVNILAHCCPDRHEPRSATTIPHGYLSQVASSCVEDDVMVHLYRTIEEFEERNKVAKSKVDRMYSEMSANPKSFLFSWKDRVIMSSICKTLEGNYTDLDYIENAFIPKRENQTEGIAKHVFELKTETVEVLKYVESELITAYRDDIVAGCVESSESVFKGILTCIQNLVKISDLKSHGQGGDVESRDDEGTFDEILSEENLITNLEKKFFKDIAVLKPQSTSEHLLT